jgi:hypothetical protein
MTKFRFGLALGLATGYYLGARAGRERYLQLNRALSRLRTSDALGTAMGKARAVVDLGRERARTHETDAFTDHNPPIYSAN